MTTATAEVATDISFAAEWGERIPAALRRYYGFTGNEWALFFEFAVSTGGASRIDAFAVNLFQSNHFRRIAYEIKVSRSDFLREIKQKDKRRKALLYSNQFYFITPPGLLRAGEIPIETGLVEVRPDLSLHVVVAAPQRDSLPPNWNLFASLARLASRRNSHEQ